MAESKVIINKHYSSPASIDASVFSTKRKINQYGVGKDEVLREGEIVLCNDENNPGIYMMTHSASTESPGKVINMTSGENIKLSPAYQESEGTGAALELSGNDTVAQAFGKTSKRIADAEGEIDGAKDRLDAAEGRLNTAESEITGVKGRLDTAESNIGTLQTKVHDIEESMQEELAAGNGIEINDRTINVLVDNTTIKFTPDGKLYAIGGGGGGQGGSYIPGSYIAINEDNVISVTGITPGDYAIATAVTESIGAALAEAKSYAESEAADAESAAKNYSDTNLQEAKDYADAKLASAVTASEVNAIVEGKGYQTETQVKGLIDEAIEGIDVSEITQAIADGDATTLNSAKTYTDNQITDVEADITSLNERLDNLDPSSIELITAYTITIAEGDDYEWQDGKVHDSGETGVFLVMVFGKPGQPDTYSYSYSNVTSLFNNELFLTEEEYETLVEEGEVVIEGETYTYDPNKMYYTYEA